MTVYRALWYVRAFSDCSFFLADDKHEGTFRPLQGLGFLLTVNVSCSNALLATLPSG